MPYANFLDFVLAGSSSGEITLWDVGSREKLVSKTFKPWDMASCTPQFQVNITAFCISFVQNLHVHEYLFSCLVLFAGSIFLYLYGSQSCIVLWDFF